VSATGQARGKVILLGEHAVVYGIPALVAGMEKGARAEAEGASEDRIEVQGNPIERPNALYDALRAVRTALEVGPVRLQLATDLPLGSGLGASAALGVATARALVNLSPAKDDQAVRRAAMAWERIFHGNPSGVDTEAAMGAGVLKFVRGEEPMPIGMVAPFDVSICVAGPPASTASMVGSVARLKEQRPEAFQKNLSAIGALVESATAALRSGDLVSLGRLMDLNHMLLASWMLSTEELETARELARHAGALGSKLTGSGGGGAVIAIGDPKPILAAWADRGLPCFSSRIGKL
jgi:mevalonate kinase